MREYECAIRGDAQVIARVILEHQALAREAGIFRPDIAAHRRQHGRGNRHPHK